MLKRTGKPSGPLPWERGNVLVGSSYAQTNLGEEFSHTWEAGSSGELRGQLTVIGTYRQRRA